MPKNKYVTCVDDDIANNDITDMRFPADAHAHVGFSDNTTDTVIAASNTPVPIAGAYISYTTKHFSFAVDTITYTYDKPSLFNIEASMSARASGVQLQKYHLYIARNGVVVPASKDVEYLDNNDTNVRSPNTNAIIELSQNDTVQVFIENTASNQNALIENISIIITQV